MRKKPEIPQDQLYRLYVAEGRNGREISEIHRIPLSRVYRMLRKFRIPRRAQGHGSAKMIAERRSEIMAQKQEKQCMAVRIDGERCTNFAVRGFRYCWMHLDNFNKRKIKRGHHKRRTR